MFSFFKKRSSLASAPLLTDVHSHLLAQLDDGVTSMEEAIAIIRRFQSWGYTKLITTPHIMSDYYRNEPAQIMAKLEALKHELTLQQIDMKLEAAAEYYLDEVLIQKLKAQEPLLTFGAKYLLFETNFLNEPFQLKEFIFDLTTQGYRPILAHPERYQYLVNDLEKAEDLRNRGVLFQINMLSLLGVYSKATQRTANQYIEKGWVDLLGSDCHNASQLPLIEEVFHNKHFKMALDLPLLNRTLASA